MRAFRTLLLLMGAVLVALTAVHAWPAGGGAGSGGAPKPAAALIEDDAVQIDVHPVGSADDGWNQVAWGFASDFVSHAGDDAAWVERISRWTTPSLAEHYRHADARRLPTGPATSIDVLAKGLGIVNALVAFRDGATAILRLEMTAPERWAVTAVESARAESPSRHEGAR